jgi:endonuclease/exonuclease/phosphatase (EEP) superfamily protein YafD
MASLDIINTEASLFTKPVYLMGDLNAEPASNLLTALGKDWTNLSGESFTFPAPKPVKCIDYILVRNAPKKKSVSAAVVDEPLASDHRPVVVKLK